MTVQETPLEERFQFGENWRRFLSVLNDERIENAERAFVGVLGTDDLSGLSFLDIGSGSGLSSLVARRLGAKVRSFDFDPNSVGCTQELRRRYFPDDPDWVVTRGSVLDDSFMASLGTFDVVYAWGVLHHTGNMWKAIENAAARVAPGGRFFLAIYADRGRESRAWWHVKRTYVKLPRMLQPPFAMAAMLPYEAHNVLSAVRQRRPLDYLRLWTRYQDGRRGMSRWHDIEDWVGGFPYEYATVEAQQAFVEPRGFVTETVVQGKGIGCHEIVFRRLDPQP